MLLAMPPVVPTSNLPTWTYTYELPDRPTTLLNGVIRPDSGVSGGGGLGGGESSPATPPKAFRLGDLIPGIAKTSSFGTGDRLDRAFIDRAERQADAPAFSIREGGATIVYSLNAANRIQGAMYATPVKAAESEARFSALRARFDARLGAPSYGRRVDDESLNLVWARSDQSVAALSLVTAGEGKDLTVVVFLADGSSPGAPAPVPTSGD